MLTAHCCQSPSNQDSPPRNPDPRFPECKRELKPIPLRLYVAGESQVFFINFQEKRSQIGWELATKVCLKYKLKVEYVRVNNIIHTLVIVPMTFKQFTRNICCSIVGNNLNSIILGTDALFCFGFRLELCGFRVASSSGCPSHKTFKVGPKNPIDLRLEEKEENFDTNLEAFNNLSLTTEEEPNADEQRWKIAEREIDKILKGDIRMETE